MHVVIYMNLQWKIILSTCLVIAICFTMASAAFESSFTKSSFDKSSATGFADAKASAMENMKTGFDKPAFNPPDPIVKPDVPEKPTMPEITRPAFNPLPAPTFRVPEWDIWRNPSSSSSTSEITITKWEAIEIAFAQFPGIELDPYEPIKAELARINAPAYPLAVNPCWIVEITGVHSDCSAYWKVPGYGIDKTIPMKACWLYGGQVIIDAVTGEVLYVNGWA
ncbi:MAG: hypothetical protein WC382_00030 [Methanoregulaceae archaeon]|jgi:hypothetical protein